MGDITQVSVIFLGHTDYALCFWIWPGLAPAVVGIWKGKLHMEDLSLSLQSLLLCLFVVDDAEKPGISTRIPAAQAGS